MFHKDSVIILFCFLNHVSLTGLAALFSKSRHMVVKQFNHLLPMLPPNSQIHLPKVFLIKFGLVAIKSSASLPGLLNGLIFTFRVLLRSTAQWLCNAFQLHSLNTPYMLQPCRTLIVFFLFQGSVPLHKKIYSSPSLTVLTILSNTTQMPLFDSPITSHFMD